MSRIIDGRITPYAFQTESQGRSPNTWALTRTVREIVGLWRYLPDQSGRGQAIQLFPQFRVGFRAHLEFVRRAERRLWIGTSGRGLFCFEDNVFSR